MAIKVHDSFAVHPGPWLRRNVLEPYGYSVTDAAEQLRVSRPPFNNLMNGKAGLSAEMAIRFEKAFGIPADTLLRMQAAHDLACARRASGALKIDRAPEPA